MRRDLQITPDPSFPKRGNKNPSLPKRKLGIKAKTFTLTTSSLEGYLVRLGSVRSSGSPDLYLPSLSIQQVAFIL